MLLRAPQSRLSPVPITYHTRVKAWELLRNYSYFDAERGLLLTLKQGFRCDLASIPRIAWWAVAPFELSIVAVLFHDGLHRHGGASGAFLVIEGGETYVRSGSDHLFRVQMRQEGVEKWRREVAYYAVRAFGAGSWRDAA